MEKPIDKVIEEMKLEHETEKIVRSEEYKERMRTRDQTPQEKANWFKKGEARGRPKGLPNKSTRVLKETISLIVNKQSTRVNKLLEQLAKDDPAKFVDLFIKLAEFIQPKLSRTEVEGNVQHTTIVIGKPADLKLPEPIDITEFKELNSGQE